MCARACVREREKEREKDRERDRERQKERQRDTYKHHAAAAVEELHDMAQGIHKCTHGKIQCTYICKIPYVCTWNLTYTYAHMHIHMSYKYTCYIYICNIPCTYISFMYIHTRETHTHIHTCDSSCHGAASRNRYIYSRIQIRRHRES